MSELINNLNEILNVKLQLKSALETESDIFSDYPSYITNLKPTGYTSVTENGNIDVSSYKYAYVGVPVPAGYAYVYGTKSITENGDSIDISSYAYVDVNVPTGGGSGSGDVIFVSSIQASDFQNLDGMNNLLSYNGAYCYALNQETFTKRYPTQGYLYSLPSVLHISKDDNVNAYIFEATSFANRTNSYSAAYNSGAGDISVIDQNPEAITSNDQFTGRLTFLYNTYQLRTTTTGPFCNDGIQVDANIGTASNSQIVVERIPFDYDKVTNVMRTSNLGLTNFGSYVVFGENDVEFKDMYDNLNHMTYDCLLQRTSYKGGFGDGKYECVFVDTYNYVGELQQPQIYGVKYGSNQFDYDSDTQCYTYVITLAANANIQARTTYFEFDVTSSSLTNYERFLFCEDINGTTPQPINFQTVKVGNEITDVKVDAKSPYACKVGSRYPSYYMQNRNNDEITFKICVNKDTWKVHSEYIEPKNGWYLSILTYDENSNEVWTDTKMTDTGNNIYSINVSVSDGVDYPLFMFKYYINDEWQDSYGTADDAPSINYYSESVPADITNSDPGCLCITAGTNGTIYANFTTAKAWWV